MTREFAGTQVPETLPYESVANLRAGFSNGYCCALVTTTVTWVIALLDISSIPLQLTPYEKVHWFGAEVTGTPKK